MKANGLSYELVPDWGRLPAGWTYTQVAGVAVDSQDRVYVYNRGEHPVVVFDREGQFLGSWGEGILEHAHGIFITPDDHVFLVDRFLHQVLKFTTDGKLLMTIGTRGEPARDGGAFNHPTDVAVTPTGEIYVSDGYGNARVQWNSPGSVPAISQESNGVPSAANLSATGARRRRLGKQAHADQTQPGSLL